MLEMLVLLSIVIRTHDFQKNRSRTVLKVENHIQTLNWSMQSPDANLIENV